MKRKRYVVGLTGASGSIYGVRLVEALLADPGREVHLIISPAGARVMREELGQPGTSSDQDPLSFFKLSAEQRERLVLHDFADIGAGPASGTFRFEAAIVCPCSVKTVGAVAAGLADNLLTRVADVALKEGRPLLLTPRETPLSLIHLRNLTRLAEAGAIILPACPAFYHRPQTIEELVGHIVQKIFDRLGLDYPAATRWGE